MSLYCGLVSYCVFKLEGREQSRNDSYEKLKKKPAKEDGFIIISLFVFGAMRISSRAIQVRKQGDVS